MSADKNPADITQLIWLCSVILNFPETAVKIGILLFYKRIFSTIRTFAICIWIAIALTSVWGIVFFVVSLTPPSTISGRRLFYTCISRTSHADRFVVQFTLTDARPVSEPWSGHATLPYDTTALGLAQVGTNLGLDVVVLCFPIPVISRLHMPTQRKVAVGLIFWLGILSVAAYSLTPMRNSDGSQLLYRLNSPACSSGRVPCYHRLRPGREYL